MTRTIFSIKIIVIVILMSLFLTGCSNKPYLTQDNLYDLVVITPAGEKESYLLNLPWNSNGAVVQRLLLESSFVLSDLSSFYSYQQDNNNSLLSQPKTDQNSESSSIEPENIIPKFQSPLKNPLDITNPSLLNQKTGEEFYKLLRDKNNTVIIRAHFLTTKKMNLVIDKKNQSVDIDTLEVVLNGQNSGQVNINNSLIFQGLKNPNLEPAFDNFVNMLEEIEQSNSKEDN